MSKNEHQNFEKQFKTKKMRKKTSKHMQCPQKLKY